MAEVRVGDPLLAERLKTILKGASGVLVTDEPPDEPQDLAVILLTREMGAFEAVRSGARCVLPPSASDEELRAAAAAAALGLVVVSPELIGEPGPDGDAALTPRELEVLELLAQGASNKVIARRLGISFHTAKFHVSAIFSKLGAHSRADAVVQGLRLGLLLL